MADYAGHAPESAGKLALDSDLAGGEIALVAPADAGTLFALDGETSLADWFAANPTAAGAAAFANGYPRHDG